MKRNIVKLLALAALPAMVVGLAGCGSSANSALTTSGTITATEVSATAQVSGAVTSVALDEGQPVKDGDPVVTLDASTLELLAKQAQAALAAAQAKLADAQNGPRDAQLRQAQATAEQASAALAGAQKNYDVIKQLYDQGAATKTQLDGATTQLQTAQAQAAAARAQADLVRQGASSEQIKQLEAAEAQAQAAADLAQLNLQRATIKAPVNGVVVRRLVEPGALVVPGTAVVTIENLEDLWLRVYVPEDQLGRVKLGQPVQVSVDAYPGRTFRAEVSYISDTAEFTPRNVQTKEERATTVYGVKLRLLDGLNGELKPGMPADVSFAAAGGAK